MSNSIDRLSNPVTSRTARKPGTFNLSRLFASALLLGLALMPNLVSAISCPGEGRTAFGFGVTCCGAVGEAICPTGSACDSGTHYDGSTTHCEANCSWGTSSFGNCCGDTGQVICDVLSGYSSCKTGLHYDGSTTHCEAACSWGTSSFGNCCGDVGQVVCDVLSGYSDCKPGTHYDGSTTHCEAGCSWHQSSFGNCCGDTGQVICDVLSGDACKPGLHYDGSTTHCEAGCSWGTSSFGNCCGDTGQVICDVLSGYSSCKTGLHYDGSTAHCEEPCSWGTSSFGNCCGDVGQVHCDPLSGYSDCKDTLAVGIGLCEVPRLPGETCGPEYPCASGSSCTTVVDDGTLKLECMPQKDNNLVGDPDICKAFYSSTISQGAIDAGITLNFGFGASGAVGIGGSAEIGVFYTEDGRYGCYQTLCYGAQSDIGIADYVAVGLTDYYTNFNGSSFILYETAGIDVVAFTTSQGWNSDTEFINHPENIHSTGDAISFGISVLPIAAGYANCTTTTEIVVTNGTASDPVAVSATPPVALCHDVEPVPGCGLSTAAASVNNGSYSQTPGVSITLSQSPAGPYSVGVTPVTLTVTDNNGLTATCTANVTVPNNTTTDTTAPVLSGQGANGTIQGPTLPTFTAPTATDNCDPHPTITYTDSRVSSGCANTYTWTRTWTAHDSSGNNSAPVSQMIVVVDTTKPRLSGQGTNYTIECPAAPVFTAPIASDNCDPNPVISHTDHVVAGSCSGAYVITRTWTATDCSGNVSTPVSQTVTVVDTTPPTLSGQGTNFTIECPSVPVFTAPTASDNCDTNPVVTHTDQTIPGTCPGSYVITRTWTATDCNGNVSSSVSQTITVVDTTAPAINCPSNIVADATTTTGGLVNFVATATDNCDSSPVVTYSSNPGTIFAFGTNTVTCTATDCSLHQTTCEFTVTVLQPQSTLADALVQLKAMRTSGLKHSDAALLDSALTTLTAANKSAAWKDGSHLRGKQGAAALVLTSVAVSKLEKLANQNPLLAPLLTKIMAREAHGCRILVEASLPGASARNKPFALISLNKGNLEVSRGHYSRGILDYHDALLRTLSN